MHTMTLTMKTRFSPSWVIGVSSDPQQGAGPGALIQHALTQCRSEQKLFGLERCLLAVL